MKVLSKQIKHIGQPLREATFQDLFWGYPQADILISTTPTLATDTQLALKRKFKGL